MFILLFLQKRVEKNLIMVYIIYITYEDGVFMLFSKDIERHCIVCRHGKKINDNEAICKYHGVVSLGHKCRRFSYDATKRIPPEDTLLCENTFCEADFSLDK